MKTVYKTTVCSIYTTLFFLYCNPIVAILASIVAWGSVFYPEQISEWIKTLDLSGSTYILMSIIIAILWTVFLVMSFGGWLTFWLITINIAASYTFKKYEESGCNIYKI